MIDYRTLLTGFIAVFLALALGMLLGSALVGSTAPVQQQQTLKALQEDFAAFRQENTRLREDHEDLRARFRREDGAVRELMRARVPGRLAGRRVALVLLGEIEDTGFLANLNDTLTAAGAVVLNTTRVSDNWVPPDEDGRKAVMAALRVPAADATDARLAGALGRAIVMGQDEQLRTVTASATGVRLDGSYQRTAQAVLLISGTHSDERRAAARVGNTPEAGLLNGIADLPVRVVAAEPDGPETRTVLPFWFRRAPATVDNIDMAAGQLSAVYALAGRDGRFGIKRAAERPIPEMP